MEALPRCRCRAARSATWGSACTSMYKGVHRGRPFWAGAVSDAGPGERCTRRGAAARLRSGAFFDARRTPHDAERAIEGSAQRQGLVGPPGLCPLDPEEPYHGVVGRVDEPHSWHSRCWVRGHDPDRQTVDLLAHRWVSAQGPFNAEPELVPAPGVGREAISPLGEGRLFYYRPGPRSSHARQPAQAICLGRPG